VYFEVFSTAWDAIQREKQIKAGPRWRKVKLIERLNPEWNDLLPSAGGASAPPTGSHCEAATSGRSNPGEATDRPRADVARRSTDPIE